MLLKAACTYMRNSDQIKYPVSYPALLISYLSWMKITVDLLVELCLRHSRLKLIPQVIQNMKDKISRLKKTPKNAQDFAFASQNQSRRKWSDSRTMFFLLLAKSTICIIPSVQHVKQSTQMYACQLFQCNTQIFSFHRARSLTQCLSKQTLFIITQHRCNSDFIYITLVQ